MSRRMIKTLGILLAICFLMSVTVAAVSADPVDNTNSSQKNAKGFMQGMQGKIVYIRNLIVATNVVIFSGKSTHPILRAAVLKRMMNNRNNNTSITDNTTADNMNDNTTADNMNDNTTADDIITDNTTADNTTGNSIIANNTTADVIAKNVKLLSQGKNVFIRNLIVARNVVIFNGRNTNPVLRAAVLKRMISKSDMMNKSETMNNTGTTDNTT